MTGSHASTSIEETPEQPMASRGESRSYRPGSDAFREFMGSGWGPRITRKVECCGATDYLPQRAAKAGKPFAGERLAIPAGTYKVRNNDCTYRFRAYSAFAHLSGLGGGCEPGSALVLEPKENGLHEAVLYFEPHTSCSVQEFYFDPQYGEFRVGARPFLEEVHQEMDPRCAHTDILSDALAKDVGRAELRIARGVDTSIEATVNEIHEQVGLSFGEEARSADEALEKRLSEVRLHKGIFELAELAQAIEVVHADFEGAVRILPRAVGHCRGERAVEGAFGAVVREEDNGLGHDTIAASGNHTNTLHWIDGDGPASEGDLIPVDASVEVDPPCTTDITRTLSINSRFTKAQTRVYQAALNACGTALARVNKLGTCFHDVHDAAMFVIATRLHEWGLLPVSVGEFLPPAGQQHRRWMPHDANHHLGLSVYNCAQTRHEMYQDVFLKPGMTFTIGPGLYFRISDGATPTEYHGIGVCIRDDVAANEGGSVTRVSEGTPRMTDDVEA